MYWRYDAREAFLVPVLCVHWSIEGRLRALQALITSSAVWAIMPTAFGKTAGQAIEQVMRDRNIGNRRTIKKD